MIFVTSYDADGNEICLRTGETFSSTGTFLVFDPPNETCSSGCSHPVEDDEEPMCEPMCEPPPWERLRIVTQGDSGRPVKDYENPGMAAWFLSRRLRGSENLGIRNFRKASA